MQKRISGKKIIVLWFIVRQRFWQSRLGFTLIELSIVLVIIGLIVGGIVVGKDLIEATTIRSQITQIQKYNTAVNAFKLKYNYLPGDIPSSIATQFGFSAAGRIGYAGWSGDVRGNGTIEGWPDTSGILMQGQCETEVFWSDLAFSNFIEGVFPSGGEALICAGGSPQLPSSVANMIPTAELSANYVYVYTSASFNWFGLSAVSGFSACGGAFCLLSNTTISVNQAYIIDSKIDDGKPMVGNVRAMYLNAGGNVKSAPNAASNSTTTCYNTGAAVYSTAYNNGNGANCALSFKFQ